MVKTRLLSAVVVGTLTDDAGRYNIPLKRLGKGRYDLVVTYPGDIDHWPALASTRVRVR